MQIWQIILMFVLAAVILYLLVDTIVQCVRKIRNYRSKKNEKKDSANQDTKVDTQDYDL